MPLIAFHFEQLNPWAVAAGIVLAPVVLLALVGGLLKVVLTLLWPGLAGTWAALAALPVGWMRQMVDWLADLPDGRRPRPAAAGVADPVVLPDAPADALAAASAPGCAGACGAGGRVLLGLILILPFQVGLTARPTGAGQTRVTLLAVGAGQCAVVEPPSGRTVLIDAGSTSLATWWRKCLGPYLRHQGLTSVDTVVVSHANYDHFSAVAEVVDAYGVREVLTSARFAEHAAGNAAAESMLASLADSQRPPRLVSPGERIPLGRETAGSALAAAGAAARRSRRTTRRWC